MPPGPSHPPRATPATRRLLRAAALCPLALAACQPAVLDPAGPVGAAERTILIDSLAIMLAIVVPTIAAILAFAWWFRASNPRAKRRPDWAYSGQIELVVWGVPLLTIMLLGGVTWIGSHQLDPAVPLASETPALEVQVVSLDWKWLFIYPEQRVASVNRLVIPAGAPVRFSITSASVMNAFFVPRLGSMIYAMNGMATHLNLQADQPGVFPGLSSHYSGDGFSDMHFDAVAMPRDGFDAWVAETRAGAGALDAGTYAKLARQGVSAPLAYARVEPDLFGRIVSQAVPPGPGPLAADSGMATPPKAEN